MNSHKVSLAKLDEDDWLELKTIINCYEEKVSTEYGAELFNWSCLMNDAYKDKPFQSPHVHWHVRPRYSSVVKIADTVFTDEEFGKHYKTRWDGRRDYLVPNEIMNIIKKSLEF